MAIEQHSRPKSVRVQVRAPACDPAQIGLGDPLMAHGEAVGRQEIVVVAVADERRADGAKPEVAGGSGADWAREFDHVDAWIGGEWCGQERAVGAVEDEDGLPWHAAGCATVGECVPDVGRPYGPGLVRELGQQPLGPRAQAGGRAAG